jgi:hypothetical protein
MNRRVIASVGLVALGAASVQAQSAITGGPAAKWWSISATVRGFYDDNINTVQNPTSADRVWGYEINPAVGVKFGNDQTTFYADYRYAFLHYDKAPADQAQNYDQNHTFDLGLDHTFSERYSVHVKDTFVIGQEPDTLRSGNAIITPFRISGDNIVNSGNIAFDAQLTHLTGLEVGYMNAWYDYKAEENAAILNRIEQDPYVKLKWFVQPETTAYVGYRYGQVNYTANDQIAPPDPSKSEIRNVRSHTGYVGVDHTFRPDLVGSIEAGATYYDYYNLNNTSFGPYANLSLSYIYAPESSAQIGFQEGRTSTDVTGDIPGDFVRDTDTSVAYASIHHRIIPHLFGNLRGTFQNAIFNGGGPDFNGKSERFYEFTAELDYQICRYFSAEIGYDYDKLDSEIPGRSYDRNKVYIGATARY